MSENILWVRIPVNRVGVLIGTSGRVKSAIEAKLGVQIEVDGRTGNVSIASAPDSQDPAAILRARDIVSAMGRGFSPERAFKLFDEDVLFRLIDLRDVFERSASDISRIKGRVIGRRGKTRRLIEELSGAYISVYGTTIAIIGELGHLQIAEEAVGRLVHGDQHKSVYAFLQRKSRELKMEESELWRPTHPSGKNHTPRQRR